MKTTEEIRDLVAQKYKYKDWNHLHIKVGGTEMDSFTDEAMELYAEQRLLLSSEAEKGEKVNDEMLKALRGVVELRQLIEYPSTVSEEHEGEASAIYNMMMKVEAAIKLAEAPSPPSPQEKQGVEEVQIKSGGWIYEDIFPTHDEISAELRTHMNALSFSEEESYPFKKGWWAAVVYLQVKINSLLTPAPAAPDKGEEKEGVK